MTRRQWWEKWGEINGKTHWNRRTKSYNLSEWLTGLYEKNRKVKGKRMKVGRNVHFYKFYIWHKLINIYYLLNMPSLQSQYMSHRLSPSELTQKLKKANAYIGNPFLWITASDPNKIVSHTRMIQELGTLYVRDILGMKEVLSCSQEKPKGLRVFVEWKVPLTSSVKDQIRILTPAINAATEIALVLPHSELGHTREEYIEWIENTLWTLQAYSASLKKDLSGFRVVESNEAYSYGPMLSYWSFIKHAESLTWGKVEDVLQRKIKLVRDKGLAKPNIPKIYNNPD